ncbi:MAG: hypothetical protein RR069_03470 [Oscillospiraceae bacterium]
MFKIIIYSNCNNNLVGLNLCKTLERYGGVLYLGNGRIKEFCVKNPAFIVYETDSLKSLNVANCVLIFDNSENETYPNILSSERISCVVNSQNTAALSKLLPLSLPAIVCGMSPRDSITISSINDTDTVISIQRELVLQSGNILEPCEMKVLNTDDMDEDDILTISAVLILFEKFKDGIIEL